jgi:hypothetical protein
MSPHIAKGRSWTILEEIALREILGIGERALDLYFTKERVPHHHD